MSAGLNDGFGSSGVTFSRKFNENLIVAATGKSDGRFREAERVDTPRDGLQRLIHRIAANIGNDRRLHREHVTVRFTGGRGQSPVRKLIVNQVAESPRRVRVNVAYEYVRVVYSANLTDGDVLLVDLLRDLIDGLVAALPDGFINLYLKH